MFKKVLRKYYLGFVLPTVLTIFLFVFSIYAIIIPTIEKNSMERKREMIKELTNTSISLIEEYKDSYKDSIYSLKEAQERAIKRIEKLRYGYENKDYFWITDMHPNMIMHPYVSDLNGTSLRDYADPNGKKLFVEAVKTVKEKNQGYIDYVWQWKDDSSKLVPKLSFVKHLDEWDWIIGTGVYIDDVKEEIKTIKNRILIITSIIIIVIIHLLLIVLRRSYILERKRYEITNKLKSSEIKYKSLFENANDAIFLLKDKIFIDCNNKTLELFACNREQIIGESPQKFSPDIQPDGSESEVKIEKHLKAALDDKKPSFEWKHIKLNGIEFDAEVNLSIVSLQNDLYILAIVRDITEKKEKDKQLKLSQKKYKTVADYTYNWEYWILPNGRFEYISPSCENITGYSRGEFIENPDLAGTIIVEEDKYLWEDHKNKSLNNDEDSHNLEFRIRTKNGDISWISHTCVSVYINNVFMGKRGSNRDITNRKLAEQELIKSEVKFRNIFNSSSDGAIIMDSNYFVLNINKTLLNMVGLDYHEAREKNILDHLLQKDIEKLKDRKSVILTNKKVEPLETIIYNKTGESIPVEINSKLIDYEGSKAILSIVRDISERKEAERKILNAIIETEEHERERFAKDLHDDIGPLLSSIKLLVKVLNESTKKEEKDEVLEKSYEIINSAITRMRELSNNLSPHLLNNFGLNTAIKSFCDKLNLGKELKIEYKSNIDSFRFDKNQEVTLYRVFIELINNTIKHARATNIKIDINKNKTQLILLYKDNGVGFDIDKKLADINKGLGLINIVQRIKSLKGNYKMESNKNEGMLMLIQINIID
jgi:PAS domain S-box-containing protein